MRNIVSRFKRAMRAFFGSPWEGANYSNKRAWYNIPEAQDGKFELTPTDRLELAKRSRYVHKNSGFHRGVVKDTAIYSIGDGLKVQSKSGSDADDLWADAYFADWSSVADISGRYSLAILEHLISKALDVDGEIFVIKTRNEFGAPRIQLVETHRVGTFGVEGYVDGISYDAATGAPAFYLVKEADDTLRPYPASQVLHVHDPESYSGGRSVPTLSHAINHMLDEGELLALEKHAVKAHSDIVRTLTKQNGEFDADGDFKVSPVESATDSDPATISRITGGKTIALNPGEKLEPYESDRPSPTFTGFLTHLRRDSAMGTLPYEFTVDPSAVGGAGVRLVVAKADRTFGWRQLLIIQMFLIPVWFYVIGDAIAKKKRKAYNFWWKTAVTTPRKISVDAGRDAAANRADVEMGLKNFTDHFAETGADFREEMTQRAEEMAFLISLADKYKIPLNLLYSPTKPLQPVGAEPSDPVDYNSNDNGADA